MKRILHIAIFFTFIATFQLSILCVVAREFDEYEVKAAFLVNFFKFVEWPQGNHDGKGNYSLCIYGTDPFGDHTKTIEDAKVKGRPVDVRKKVSVRNLKECNILFVSSSERRRINYVLDQTRGMNILTVGDTDGYAQSGVMFNFFIEEKKVRFEINLRAIQSTKINVSSQLLKIGRIVGN